MAGVREEAEDIRKLLVDKLRLDRVMNACQPSVILRMGMFLETVDEGLHVQAGPLKISHGFLFSFYGITVTYIAVLMSSSLF